MFILICLLSLYAQDNQAAWSSLSDWSENAYACVRSAGQKMYQATAHCCQSAYNIGTQIYQKSKKHVLPIVQSTQEWFPRLMGALPILLKYYDPHDDCIVSVTESVIGMAILCPLLYTKPRKALIPALTLTGMVCGHAAGLLMPEYLNIIALGAGCAAYIGSCQLQPTKTSSQPFRFLLFSALGTELLALMCTKALKVSKPLPWGVNKKFHPWPKTQTVMVPTSESTTFQVQGFNGKNAYYMDDSLQDFAEDNYVDPLQGFPVPDDYMVPKSKTAWNNEILNYLKAKQNMPHSPDFKKHLGDILKSAKASREQS